MTLKEKVTLAAQPNRLYLFKEGMFYKIYNQNAMWFVHHIKRYNVTVKYIKNIQQEVYSIGFPITYLASINLKPFALQNIANTTPKLLCYTITQQPIKQINYINWCANLPRQNAQPIQIIQPNLNNITMQTKIINQLQNFEMATKTPIQAFEFLIQLKKMV
jgi:hypothetical protein